MLDKSSESLTTVSIIVFIFLTSLFITHIYYKRSNNLIKIVSTYPLWRKILHILFLDLPENYYDYEVKGIIIRSI